ncbi:LD-carboxypeptidase [Pedobacter sp. PAMC26386]|nr:LD-carboxypeptidase [Pedobacter sp. PAMC26386]
MNRKHFISSLVASGVLLPAVKSWASLSEKEDSVKLKRPPYLNPGDTIGITSPAGHITLAGIQPSVQLMQSWGFKIETGSTIGKKVFTYGGTDEERRDDLQQMLDNPSLKAIMCARGGYGLIRIIDQLNFSKFVKYPKWLIGFSDITVLHSHVNQNFGIATIHSKMCNSFPNDWAKAKPIQISTILSIRKALTGEDLKYTAPIAVANRVGKREGVLVGGNLSIIASNAGTKSDIDTKGKILFLEDTGEYLYSVDRMFWNLKRTGKLAQLAGLVIGGFSLKSDDPEDIFGKSIYEIVMEKIAEYDYPVCFDFPVGHQRDNFALKCGTPHRLEVGTEGTVLSALK